MFFCVCVLLVSDSRQTYRSAECVLIIQYGCHLLKLAWITKIPKWKGNRKKVFFFSTQSRSHSSSFNRIFLVFDIKTFAAIFFWALPLSYFAFSRLCALIPSQNQIVLHDEWIFESLITLLAVECSVTRRCLKVCWYMFLYFSYCSIMYHWMSFSFVFCVMYSKWKWFNTRRKRVHAKLGYLALFKLGQTQINAFKRSQKWEKYVEFAEEYRWTKLSLVECL